MTTASLHERYDVGVIGGGPGGATAAACLARAGLSVACFERERFPRFHIGESLLPANVPLFERLGVLDAIEAHGFLRKYGAVLVDDRERRQVVLDFQAGPEWTDYAYNVPRAEFDHLLLRHAAKVGAAIFQETEVAHVEFGPGGVRLSVQAADGGSHQVATAFLVDASGRDGFLATRVGRREPMPDLGKVALFAHFENVARLAGRREGHIRLFLFPHGWFWIIPFTGRLTSVGCVLHQRTVKQRSGDREMLFRDMVAACPSVAAAVGGATQVIPVHSAANFSYRIHPAVGDRFVTVGDAVTFIDPIFSTGVYVSMQSAEMASRVIVSAFHRGAFRAEAFAGYRRRLARGINLFFRFIRSYYDPAFLDVMFTPNPPRSLLHAVMTVLAGGGFLRQPVWLRLRLALIFLVARRTRHARISRGLPVESCHPW
jgi:flavin-dependent dehydrogenase